ncbi:hypothetical protein R3W88_019565 [Solanum pinnatisectum]|uniref:Protein kinase domain-containing protein n=1 Tax=Solanum pinnatisectum TaxID=50273 RepID=A0AAV9KKI1_9SOLN|nr:hypothetical protein R3W88_019565 [Solanum pinnatisectum]
MAKLLWERGTTLGQSNVSGFSSASTSNSLFHGITLPSLIVIKSCNYSASKSLKEEEEFLHMFKHSPRIIHCFGANLHFKDQCYLLQLIVRFELKKYTKNVLLGLSCIYTNVIIHCDIKPDNIRLVGTDGNAKIADFRLSMTFEQAMKEKGERMIRGTKRYMAPELALGCTVYELIMGKPLWDRDDDHVLQKIEFEKPKFHNSMLSKEANDFLKRCLRRISASNSSKAVNTTKTRKKKSGSKSLLQKPIQKIMFKLGNHKFVMQLPVLKEVENEVCGRVLGTDK